MDFSLKPNVDAINAGEIYMPSDIPDIIADSANLFGVTSKPTYGFVVGIVSNLRLGEHFDLRFIPSLSFGERKLEYSIYKYRTNNLGEVQNELITVTKRIPSTFIDLPLHLKFKTARIHNARAYVITGFKYSIDLASEAKRKQNNNDIIVRLDKSDLAFELGVGFDFYAFWFKFGTEVKMSYGLNNLVQKDNSFYADGLDYVNSKILQVSFTFE